MTLTQKDVDLIEKIVDERMEFKFPNLSAKIDKIWVILVQLTADIHKIGDELTITNHHLTQQEKRTTKLETIHPRGEHAS
ncbi:MAG: hypothetical protein Q7K43_02480 [Candidatus Woesearchaeota archaeon]|nr:hypothetical protein [Candidatus Woesearchaeota archaeon]